MRQMQTGQGQVQQGLDICCSTLEHFLFFIMNIFFKGYSLGELL
jgi:hypothetical protein